MYLCPICVTRPTWATGGRGGAATHVSLTIPTTIMMIILKTMSSKQQYLKAPPIWAEEPPGLTELTKRQSFHCFRSILTYLSKEPLKLSGENITMYLIYLI
jgi:hypothetical protein